MEISGVKEGDIIICDKDIFGGEKMHVVVEVINRNNGGAFSRVDCWDGTSFDALQMQKVRVFREITPKNVDTQK